MSTNQILLDNNQVPIDTPSMSLNITELLVKSIESACKDLVNNAIRQCADKYHFDADEAIHLLGTSKIQIHAKKMIRGLGKLSTFEKVGPNNKNKKDRNQPFRVELVDPNLCQGIKYNHALFTQCTNNKTHNEYCNACHKSAINNNGIPICGNVQRRIELADNFTDFKNRRPSQGHAVPDPLANTINSEEPNNTSIDTNTDINSEQVTRSVTEHKARGRPKKVPTPVSANDMFAIQDDDVSTITTNTNTTNTSDIVNKSKLTAEEKLAKKAAFDEHKKKEKDIKKQLEKEVKEEKKKLEKESKEEKKRLEKEAKNKQHSTTMDQIITNTIRDNNKTETIENQTIENQTIEHLEDIELSDEEFEF